MKHIFRPILEELHSPVHQTKLRRPAANRWPLPVVVHLWVNWSAPAGYRGNYNLATTCIWLYCLTLWQTHWDGGMGGGGGGIGAWDWKLKAHSGNDSAFPPQSFAPNWTKLSQDESGSSQWGEKYLLLLSSSHGAALAEIKKDFQCILRRKIFSLSLPRFHLRVTGKVARQEEQFHNIAVEIIFTDRPLFKLWIVLMFNRIMNWARNTIM